MSPVFVPAGDLDVPAGFSKTGDTLLCISGHRFYVTLSIGIAHYPVFKTTEDIVAAADRALYRAKINGRNRVEIELI